LNIVPDIDDEKKKYWIVKSKCYMPKMKPDG